MKSFADAKQYPVKVYFADERIAESVLPLLPPVLQTNSALK